MPIKIKKNGKIENFILSATDVRVLDFKDKFKNKDLENVLKEVSDTEHIHIGDIDESKDGIWIDDETLNESDNNNVVERMKCYIDNKIKDYANPNLLINGDFQVWQRGKSLSYDNNNKNIYTADRWRMIQSADGGNCTVYKSNNSLSIGSFSKPLGIAMALSQRLEFFKETNEIYTLSVRYSSNMKADLCIRELGDNLQELGSVFMPISPNLNTVSVTFDASKIVNKNNIEVVISFSSLEEFNMKQINLHHVKLEYGSLTTPFVPRSYEEELALCQRYYFKNHWKTLRTACITDKQLRTCEFNFPVEMRVAPTIQNLVEQPINEMYTSDLKTHIPAPSTSKIVFTPSVIYNHSMCDFQFAVSGLEIKDYILEIKDYAYEFDAEIY